MQGDKHSASSAHSPDPPSSIPPLGGRALERFPTLRATGQIVATMIVYAILADAAIETFFSRTPGRWITVGLVAAYGAVAVVFGRRVSWAI